MGPVGHREPFHYALMRPIETGNVVFARPTDGSDLDAPDSGSSQADAECICFLFPVRFYLGISPRMNLPTQLFVDGAYRN